MLTVAYQGELEHRDTSGGGGKIGAGNVQWMTAGNGITHEEFHSQAFTHKGGTLQLVRLWVNLRARDKGARAGYQTLLKGEIPTGPLPHDAGTIRIIAGDYGGQKGPATTFTPINLWDVNVRARKPAELPFLNGHTTAFLVLSGEVLVNGKKGAREGVQAARPPQAARLALVNNVHPESLDRRPARSLTAWRTAAETISKPFKT